MKEKIKELVLYGGEIIKIPIGKEKTGTYECRGCGSIFDSNLKICENCGFEEANEV
ncbi:MAG: hypothetical protein OEL89_00760 [Candidatus Peregrinibacteria bacterium]|nr:hypothetical protein [Candidatus Peregrinibacteria bacterium]